jgi:type IV fimbrial biogenesis protein FimT
MAANMRKSSLSKSISGFTIIELMVTLVVLSIMLAFGVPEFATALANSRVRSGAESVKAGLRYAQIEALQRSANTELVITASSPDASAANAASAVSARNWIVRVMPDPLRGIGAPIYVKGSADESASGAMLQNQSGGTSVIFQSNGRVMQGTTGGPVPLAAPFVVSITAPGTTRPLCVFASTTGSIKVCDPKLAVGDPRSCLPALAPSVCPQV